MTRVCLVGDDDVNLQYELLSRETARDALVTYDLHEPFANAIGVETVSLGAAVALLNDLDWYLVRFVETAMVLEPSVSDDEWLSRSLATAVRDDRIAGEETGRFLKIYGLEPVDAGGDTDAGDESADGQAAEETEDAPTDDDPDGPDHRLVEPMFVTRTGETLPEYDLRDVAETLTVRVTEDEFGA
jgi:hypothetical protein